MPMKTYFLTTEIIPFAETGLLAQYSKYVPLRLQELEHDIRLTAPKYGFISERKYILREVIRLREINSTFNHHDVKASAKSAFIPRTRVQVYFMEHDEWFQPLNPLLYKFKNGRPLHDNDDRFGFFGKIALEMLTNLFWSPDIIICNNWQSAFVPILYKQQFESLDFYKDIKTVHIIHSLNDFSNISGETYEKLDVKLPKELTGEKVNSQAVAATFADMVIVLDTPETKLSNELPKQSGFKPIFESLEPKLKTLTLKEANEDNLLVLAEEIHELLQTLS